jgi:chromate transport protein ChrA
MPQTVPLLQLIVLLYAVAVSWIEERFGKFQDLEPNQKQLFNALAGFAVPLVFSFVTGLLGKWPESIGTPGVFTLAVVSLVASVVVWLLTQVAHYADLALVRLVGNR